MIYLIGGPPRCGKTTLAKRVSKELGIPWISTDAFDYIAQHYVSESDRAKLFPKLQQRIESGGGSDEVYETFTIDQIVEAFLSQAKTIHRAIKGFVDQANDEGWDYIIEGFHLTPDLIHDLTKQNPDIRAITLISKHSKETIKRSLGSNAKSDWLRDRVKNKETYPKIEIMINSFSNEIDTQSEGLGLKVIDVTDNLERYLDEAYTYLTE